MKRVIIYTILTILTLIALISCGTNTATEVNIEEVEGNVHQVNLDIEGMYCASCSTGVAYQLEQLDGVISADIDYKEGTGVVIYDADKVTAEEIAAASTEYPATVASDEVM
jgi:copper chaperone CopZ